MEIEVKDMELEEPNSTSPTPKLSLFSLPCKTVSMQGIVTPPVHTVATVPFQWEEAPGKPRSTTTTTDDPPPAKSKTVRSLDLPPRLLNTTTTSTPTSYAKVDIMPSPTTVLGGPCEGRSSKSPEMEVVSGGSDSSNSVSSKARVTMPLKKLMSKEKSPVTCGSWRWHSFRDLRSSSSSSSRSDFAAVSSFDDLFNSLDSKVKITKVTRRGSFTFTKGTSSGFLASVYGSLKQAVPWRRRRG